MGIIYILSFTHLDVIGFGKQSDNFVTVKDQGNIVIRLRDHINDTHNIVRAGCSVISLVGSIGFLHNALGGCRKAVSFGCQHIVFGEGNQSFRIKSFLGGRQANISLGLQETMIRVGGWNKATGSEKGCRRRCSCLRGCSKCQSWATS